MQGIIVLIVFIVLISSGLSAEKKKKEIAQASRLAPMPGRNNSVFRNQSSQRNKAYSSGARKRKSNEESILEKAARNTDSTNYANLSVPGGSVIKEESEKPQVTLAPENRGAKIEMPQSIVSVSGEKMRETERREKEKKEEQVTRVLKEKEEVYKEVDALTQLLSHKVFDDFCASDALYLARKDVMTGKTWL